MGRFAGIGKELLIWHRSEPFRAQRGVGVLIWPHSVMECHAYHPSCANVTVELVGYGSYFSTLAE